MSVHGGANSCLASVRGIFGGNLVVARGYFSKTFDFHYSTSNTFLPSTVLYGDTSINLTLTIRACPVQIPAG